MKDARNKERKMEEKNRKNEQAEKNRNAQKMKGREKDKKENGERTEIQIHYERKKYIKSKGKERKEP
jgi:hypothetical protein